MNGNRLLVGALSALTLFTAQAVLAAEQSPSSHGMEMQMGKKMDGKMSCDSMMGAGMMGKNMMGGMMSHDQMMPSLPPGNEKLNLQMHAEMMQSMGAILQKYADRLSSSGTK